MLCKYARSVGWRDCFKSSLLAARTDSTLRFSTILLFSLDWNFSQGRARATSAETCARQDEAAGLARPSRRREARATQCRGHSVLSTIVLVFWLSCRVGGFGLWKPLGLQPSRLLVRLVRLAPAVLPTASVVRRLLGPALNPDMCRFSRVVLGFFERSAQ